MGRKAGALLWNRVHIATIAGDGTLDVDTGLTQPGQAFPEMSPGEPTMGTRGAAPPADGTLPASRIMVMPMAPTATWASITHSEPYLNTTTNTIHVLFTNAGEGAANDLNVLFWDPHSVAGPGDADTYNTLAPG